MKDNYLILLFAVSFHLCPVAAQNNDGFGDIKSVKEVDAGLGFKNKEVEFYEKGNSGYNEVLRNYQNNQRSSNRSSGVYEHRSGGIQVDRDPPSWARTSPQSKSRQTTIRNRQIRNAQIEKHNQEIRAYNQMIVEQRRLEEERREAERQEKIRREKQRLYNEGYARSMASSARSYERNLHTLREMNYRMEDIRNNHQLDGIPRYSGYVSSGSSKVTTKRSKVGILPKRNEQKSNNGLDFNAVPITQISDASSPDFLPIEIPTRRTYRAIELKPELTWEWVREHPEDTWAWIKDKVTNVDEFLDYQEAIASGKDNFFTNTVRRKYMDLKMEWYNHDMTERISSAYSTTLTTLKDLVDNPDAIRENMKDKVVESAKGYAKDNMLKPVPIVTKFINENTLLHIPTIEMKSLENAKDLIGLRDVAKVLDKDFAKSAVDAVYNGDIAYMQIINKKQNEVVKVVHRQTGSVLGREFGINTNKAIIEPAITSIDALDKSKAETDDKAKVKVYVSNTFVPYVRKDITKRAKSSVVNDFKDVMEEELILGSR